MSNAPQCFDVPDVSEQEHIAIKNLYAGEATPDQQRLAVVVIITKFSRAKDNLFIPGKPDETAFLEGRGFVGQKILKYLHLPVVMLPEQTEER